MLSRNHVYRWFHRELKWSRKTTDHSYIKIPIFFKHPPARGSTPCWPGQYQACFTSSEENWEYELPIYHQRKRQIDERKTNNKMHRTSNWNNQNISGIWFLPCRKMVLGPNGPSTPNSATQVTKWKKRCLNLRIKKSKLGSNGCSAKKRGHREVFCDEMAKTSS